MDDGAFLVAIVFIAFVAFASFQLGLSEGVSDMQSEATKQGYGQYCPNTGEWAWKDMCK